ncbi:unnamed protein product [Discula destructiva]
MAPKTPSKDGAVADSSKSDVVVLCHMLMSVTDLKLDNKALAPLLGLTAAKNVPRSINNRLKPHGFEYKSGKVFPIGQEPAIAAADGDPSTPVGKTKAPTVPKTPASKKRKIADTVKEEANDSEDQGEGNDSQFEV